jgi:tetratricopeptide (TPR) repeat protein
VAAGGDPRRTARALEVLGNGKDTGTGTAAVTASVEDRRARSRVLALQNGRTYRQDAVGILENLIREGAATPQDQFLLASLYEADGDWAKARDRYRRLLATEGGNPEYLASYIRALLKHGQPDEAREWLGKLERAVPRAPVLAEFKARLLAAQGQGGEAAGLVTAYLKDNPLQTLPFAVVLEEIGQREAAERAYRGFLDQSRDPRSVLVLAGYFSRQGRFQEALDLCDRAWDTCPPDAVSTALLTILYAAGGRADERQVQRAEERVEKAVREHSDLSSLQFDLANIQMLRGRYDAAEASLLKFYERDKTRGSPLNNLAWMLAVRGETGERALQFVNRAIELDGETPDLLDTRGVVLLARGQGERAARDLESVVARKPSADAYFHLARAYQQVGRPADAAKSFHSAQSRGLTAESLHPLERPTFDRLVADLARH